MPDKIRITHEELFSPRIDDIVAEQEALLRPMGEFGPTSLWRRIVFNSLFFLTAAGLIGGIAGWAILEPFFNESIVVWGKIEYVKEAEWPGLAPTAQTVIAVRGVQLYVDSQATRIEGRGEYAEINGAGELKTGQPVRVQAFVVDADNRILFAERVSVRAIPPGRDQEPLPDVGDASALQLVSGLLAFAIVGACIAGCVAAADGVMSRNLRRGFLCCITGIGIAAAGGLVGLIPAGLIFGLAQMIVQGLAGDGMWTSATLTGWPFMALVIGRSLAWGVFGLSVGLGHGVALRSKKLIVNGLLGGLLGALLGGMCFEPIIKLFANTDLGGQALMSRAFGFGIIGTAAGFMIGLVEHLSKDAWLLMRAGPLAGKQFVIYKSPTALGSSPKCEIYLFKDPGVEPRHALIRKVGNRHEIEDLSTPAGTIVNGKKARRQPLKDGDQIMLGQTVLEYAERSRGAS